MRYFQAERFRLHAGNEPAGSTRLNYWPKRTRKSSNKKISFRFWESKLTCISVIICPVSKCKITPLSEADMSEVRGQLHWNSIHYRRLALINYQLLTRWGDQRNEWEWYTMKNCCIYYEQMLNDTEELKTAIPFRQTDIFYNEWYVLGAWSMCERIRSAWESMNI